MTNPSEDLLTTTEGVDEGSAASTAEGTGPQTSTEEPTAGAGGSGSGSDSGSGSGPSSDATPAPPVDMESDESRAARDAAGPGQQLQAGEG